MQISVPAKKIILYCIPQNGKTEIKLFTGAVLVSIIYSGNTLELPVFRLYRGSNPGPWGTTASYAAYNHIYKLIVIKKVQCKINSAF
jgi:hypothetical protein